MSDARLLIGFLAAPLAWAAQLVIGYGIEEIACSAGTTGDDLGGIGVEAVVVAVTVVFGLVALAAAVMTFLAWRRPGRPDPNGRIAFMSFGGMLWSLLFLVIIVLGGVQLLALDSCAG